MTTEPARESPGPSPLTPGWKVLGLVAVFYLGCLVVATWPAFATFGSTLPSRIDPLAHLWTMRWNKACLVEGRLPFFCPEIQYPVGAPLGTLPPMHFQTLIYIPLSWLTSNDILCYNVIRTCSFLLTGLGTFLLIWNVVRSRLAACLGGMMAMIGGPMLCFSHGELEQITVGWFPIFLIAWLRWVDRPSLRGLAASSALYALVAMSAPYHGVFAVFPAALYVAWRAIGSGRSGIVPWLRARTGWLLGFAAVAASVLVVLFSNQVWSLMHGLSMARPEAEFAKCRAPLWGYLVPPPGYLLSRLLPFDTSVQHETGPVPSYLGVVTLALVAYAAIARVKFARRSYWWAVLALLVLLSMGAYARVGGVELSLPAAWLKKYFVAFRMIRVPARFSLFASVVAGVVAAAGLRHLLSKLPNRPARIAAVGALAALALADLSTIPYLTIDLPPRPACYEVIRKADPDASFLEVPQFNSGAFQLPALCTYWQSFHGGKTSAGYTAFLNVAYDNLLYYNSPFDAFKMAQPDYLMRPEGQGFELADQVDFRSYAWLFLQVHKLRYVVVHHRIGAFPEFVVHVDRLKAQLQEARVFEDEATAVFDRDRLPTPTRPVLLYAEGWGDRALVNQRPACMLGRVAKVHVYNPSPERPLTFVLDARANLKPRTVILRSEGLEIARWQASADAGSTLVSPPFTLKAGLVELTLECDGEDKASRADLVARGLTNPFSLWALRVGLIPAPLPSAVAEKPNPEARH
jgi:hypothetical protein